MISRRSILAVAALTFLARASLAWADPKPLYCDTGSYEPLRLTWRPSPETKQAERIFPHPFLPARALAASSAALWITDDAGRTWAALPQATAEKIGPVRAVAFHPLEKDAFYVASATKGVWATADAGKTFRQMGVQAGGMASDAIADLIVYSGDTTHRTLLAVHGDAECGVSRTRDGGKTWDILNPGYHFRRIICRRAGASELFLFGSTKAEPEVQNLYHCTAPSELPMELLRDAMLTDMAFSNAREPAPLYVATSDAGLQRVSGEEQIDPIGPSDANWASVSPLFGPNADVIGLCLYDSSQKGLVLSTDELATVRTVPGPVAGALVKDGAAVRPNANSTVFYAVANGTLSIGYPQDNIPGVSITPASFAPSRDDDQVFDDAVAALRDFRKQPASASAAKDAADLRARFGDLSAPYRRTQLTVTARVPIAPSRPESVTADLSRLGGSETTPLFDDGKHGDGAAGDGVYGGTMCFRPLAYSSHAKDWRRTWPGPVAIGVTASYPGGERDGSVGIASVYPKITTFGLWDRGSGKGIFSIEGDAKAELVPSAAGKPNAAPSLCVQTGKGPWSVLLRVPFGRSDITGYQAVAFKIKSEEGKSPGEVYVQLRDTPELTAPVTTGRFPAVAQGVREASLGPEYRL
ncbi:MAG: hypothetical protein PHQ12_14605, partial [Chthoniobacteraceae bacterium]|nr:hypothetical protein [Chthoniobacteraceae bacterium]